MNDETPEITLQEHPMQKIIAAVEMINKLNQVEGDQLITVLADGFTFAELEQVSAFFHEALKESHRRGIMSIITDVRG